MQRGVFYTPRPVVSYIVRSVDELLRTEFGLADGLADTTTWGEMAKRHKDLKIPEGASPDQDFVQILDPATGTGTFLVEVIDLIHKTLVAKWKAQGHGEKKIDALWNEYVPKHLLTRLHGYELLMAPYAIAHLKIGLKLYETGYRFGSDERARVYLTNALEPAHETFGKFEFAIQALAHEARDVSAIKRRQRFTVVLGNPPYSGISANMQPWIDGLLKGQVDSGGVARNYYVVDGKPLGERKLWLQDDYVKFVRLAQWILSQAGAGVLGYITNNGYLDNPTFRGMRKALLDDFHALRIVNAHGDVRKLERAPGGGQDRNLFDISQGVSIAVCVLRNGASGRDDVYADLWGERDAKYAELLAGQIEYRRLEPRPPFYFFVPGETGSEDTYDGWTSLAALMPTYSSGVITARDEIVLDYEPGPILDRIRTLRETTLSDRELRGSLFQGKGSSKYPPGDSRGWKLPAARQRLRKDPKWQEHVVQCAYRPFDIRCVYLVEWMVDWSRPELLRHLSIPGNVLLVFPRNTGVGKAWSHVFVSRRPILGRFFPDSACITYMAPALVYREASLSSGRSVAANFRWRKAADPTGKGTLERLAFDQLGYAYALLHSPTYRAKYEGLLRRDFPHVPVSDDKKLVRTLADLGDELIKLHLLEADALAHGRPRWSGRSLPRVEAVSRVGEDVWLDDTCRNGFRSIPAVVWDFKIGGYQVCDKWLKDRKGRTLSKDDITHYQKIVVALSETVRLMKEIDEVIEQHGGWPGAFQIGGGYKEAASQLSLVAEPSIDNSHES